jgi:CheY-like chemotaxis protein
MDDLFSAEGQEEDSPKRRCILIADDSEMMRLAVRGILEPHGYELIEAADGEEALATAFLREPDMIFLDWIMPKKSALEVLRVLKETPRTQNIPVCLLTILQDPGEIRQAAQFGVVDYISKPANPQRVMDKVRKYLG